MADLKMADTTRTQLEAAAWRSFVGHLQSRTDVQNIEKFCCSGVTGTTAALRVVGLFPFEDRVVESQA